MNPSFEEEEEGFEMMLPRHEVVSSSLIHVYTLILLMKTSFDGLEALETTNSLD